MELEQTVAKRVSASIMRICERSAFFAALAMYARVEASTQIPTAATDGYTVFVNPGFFDALSQPEQDGLILHEVLHAALLHVPRRAGRDPKLWNIAADIVINGMILREGMQLPKGGMIDPTLQNFSSEEVYEKLLAKGNRAPTGGESDLLDKSPSDATQRGTTEHDLSGEPTHSREKLEGHWQPALEQAEMVAQSSLSGTMPGGLARELSTLRAATLDWKSYLWRFLTQTPTDFSEFDRRFTGRGLYLETIAGESVRVLVAVDTSGSINGAALDALISEVQGILAAYPHLICELFFADTKLDGPHRLKAGDVIPKPKGGGGTDFVPFFDYIATHPFTWGSTVAIYLTDGYGRFPPKPPRCPVLWVVTPGGRDLAAFPFGETVRLLKSQSTPFVMEPH